MEPLPFRGDKKDGHSHWRREYSSLITGDCEVDDDDDHVDGAAAAEKEKKSSAEPANRNERAGTLVRATDGFWVQAKPPPPSDRLV